MKLFKNLFIAAVAGLAVFSASAQTVDVFNGTRILQVVAPTTFVSAQSPLTNAWVDLIGYGGRGILLLTVNTNAASNVTGGGALAVQVQTSPDTNVWTDLQNYGYIASATAITYTNLYFSTNFITTDNFLLPFTATSPTASTAGFATPYPLPNVYTNTASTNLVVTSGNYVYGINLTDCPRYLKVILLNSTAAKTNTVSATLIGTRMQ